MSISLMTRLAYDWGVRCFGWKHMRDPRIRTLRCAEEIIELAQSLGLEKEILQLLVEKVYDRPPGDAMQELGGSLLTLCVLCQCLNHDDIETVFEMELRRCLAIDPIKFAERNRQKLDMGLR